MLRENTNELKLIQLGLTLSDEHGNFPTPHCTWQFNFKFDLSKEKFNSGSINLLVNSGIDFLRLATSGLEHQVFAEHIMTSGLIANPDVVWYGFHTDHDFAYLLKLISGERIPSQGPSQFMKTLKLYFPQVLDVKVMAESVMTNGFRGGLSKLACSLGVTRDDQIEHQAGSDSKLTARCLFALIEELGSEAGIVEWINEVFNISY